MHPRAILQWYVDAGIDEVIEDTPVNRFTAPKPVAVTTPARKPGAPVLYNHATDSPRAASTLARQMAEACNTVDELELAVRKFDGCVLKKTAQNTVFADGNPNAEIMFIGEAPGASEDAQGIPFCGPSGLLLDAMLKSIGLDRKTNAYITNTLYWRPPGNRQPSTEELEICRPFVERHVALMNPKLLVLVGGTATKAMLEKEIGITKLRGRFYRYTNRYLDHEIPVGVIYHPSYLLRQPAHKRFAWHDLLKIQQCIRNNFQVTDTLQ